VNFQCNITQASHSGASDSQAVNSRVVNLLLVAARLNDELNIELLTAFALLNVSVQRHKFAATLTCCHFHLCQSVWRHVQQLGLQQQYSADEQVGMAVHMLPALAFVPEDHVVSMFEKLSGIRKVTQGSSSACCACRCASLQITT
jgi:hypothetical protein